MSLQSLGFWLFLPITALIDLHLPVKWQNPFLAAASLLFYFYNLPSDPARAAVTLAALAGVCVFVYAMALAIGRPGYCLRRPGGGPGPCHRPRRKSIGPPKAIGANRRDLPAVLFGRV